MAAEPGNIPAPLGIATLAAAATAAETPPQQDATMGATTGARTGNSPPAKQVPKRRSDDNSPVRADASGAPSTMTLEELNDVVLKLQSDKAIESKWRSNVEIAITNHADLLDRRDREALHFRTEVSKMKQELTAASQAFAQLGGSESLQQDLKKVMSILQDNDALIKNKLVTVEADLKQLYDSTLKALNEGVELQLRQRVQEAISDVARRLQQVETGREAQQALAKSSECDLHVADVKAAIVIGTRDTHEKALLVEKQRLLQIMGQMQARLRRVEEASLRGAPLGSAQPGEGSFPEPVFQPAGAAPGRAAPLPGPPPGPRVEGFPVGRVCRGFHKIDAPPTIPSGSLSRPHGAPAADPLIPIARAQAREASATMLEEILRA